MRTVITHRYTFNVTLPTGETRTALELTIEPHGAGITADYPGAPFGPTRFTRHEGAVMLAAWRTIAHVARDVSMVRERHYHMTHNPADLPIGAMLHSVG